MDKFEPVAHDEAFVRRIMEKPGVKEAYAALGGEYALLRELLHARKQAEKNRGQENIRGQQQNTNNTNAKTKRCRENNEWIIQFHQKVKINDRLFHPEQE